MATGERGAQRSGLGELLLAHRRRLLWTQERLASESGVSSRTLSDLERGVSTGVRLGTLRRLADALGLTDIEAQQLLDAAMPAQDRGTEGLDDDELAARAVATSNRAVERSSLEVVDAERSTDRAARCRTLIQFGRTATLAMRRHDARPAYVRAAQLALSLDDRASVVVAAAGYSFMTKNGDAGLDADETWRRALVAIPTDDLASRAILSGARSTAQVLAGSADAAATLSEHALSLARGSGSPDALAVAISAHDRATRGHPNTNQRLELGRELAELSGSSLDHVALAGVELCAGPLLELGDLTGFERCASELQGQARAARHPFALAQAEAWAATAAMLRDEQDEAEARSARAVSLSGHAPNFTEGHLAQVFSMRRAQGRGGELLDVLDQANAPDAAEFAWRSAWVVAAAADPARQADVASYLERLRLELWPLERTWTFPVTLAWHAEAAHRAQDSSLATMVFEALAPYRGRSIVVATATSCEGAVDHYLGLAAAAMGDARRGRSFLERGAALHERLESPHLLAMSEQALLAC